MAARLGYVLGTPRQGTNPDKTLFTIDWRFTRRWSMDATVGDRGSSVLDMLWRYRH